MITTVIILAVLVVTITVLHKLKIVEAEVSTDTAYWSTGHMALNQHCKYFELEFLCFGFYVHYD